MLEPYGQDNEEPAFVATHLQVAGTPRFMGSNDTHMSFCVSQGGYSLRSLIFGRAAEFRDLIRPGVRCSMAFVPGVNEFRGESSVELRVLDLHVEE
jgi:single-stranded-DNA-specific exonuclease